jgi:hypothetical protein
MFEGFTDAARDLVTLAHEEATILRHERIGAEHLILGFIRVRPGTLRVRRQPVALVSARREVTRLAARRTTAQLAEYLPYSPEAEEAIASASSLATARREEQVEPEHVLLALLGQAERGAGVGRVLAALHADLAALGRQAERALAEQTPDEAASGPAARPAPGPARQFTPRLLTAKTATQLDFPAGRRRLGAAIAGVLVAAYLGWSLAVSAGGHLSSGERRIYLLLLLLVLTFLLGLSAYFGVKRFDSAVDGWRIASPPARVLLPAGYVLVGVFPLAVLAGAALLMDMEVFGAARVRHLLTHLGSNSLDPRAWYLILAPLALGLAVGVLFVPQWHYSLAPLPAMRRLYRIFDDLPDDLPDGVTPVLDARIDKLWERRYTSFGTDLLSAVTMSLRTAALTVDCTILGRPNLIGEVVANARATAEICLRHPQRARNYMFTDVRLSELADALWLLFQTRPDRGALEDAIWARRRVAEAWMMSRADHRVNAVKLAGLLAARAEIAASGEDEKDLAEALALAQSAWRIRAADPRADALLTLGQIEQARFRREQDQDAMRSAFDASARAYRQAVATGVTEGEAEYRLAMLLAARAERDGDEAGRQEALALLRPLAGAAGRPAAGEPDSDDYISPEKRARFMTGLADVLAAAGEEGKAGEEAEAVTWYERAATVTSAPAPLRFAAACGWGRYARDPVAAANGYDQAVRLLSLVVWPGLSHSAQVRLLAGWPELAVDAAAAQLAAARPERAVEILEQGRVLMWSQRVALSSASLDRLRQSDPGLFGRLADIRAELNAPVIGGAMARFGRSNAGSERRAALYREWDGAVRHHDLLGSPGYEDLRAAASAGPVILLNASRLRCDALIITSTLPVRQLELPAEIYPRADPAVAAWQQLTRAGTAQELAAQRADDDMLAWLWRDVTGPVLSWLADHGQLPVAVGELPRVWWCPAGRFARLPVHAAGLPGRPGESVPDRVISSYTPTLTQLIRARRANVEPGSPDGRMLILAPDSELPHSREEADLVGQRFPGHLRLPGDAGKAEYLREISRHSLLHFAGHGFASEHDVCHAAAPDRLLPDEAVHPAAALHFGGFTNVIATLNPAGDRVAMSVALAVYSALVRDGALDESRSARALHDAVCERRGHRQGHWGPWTTFLHIGP